MASYTLENGALLFKLTSCDLAAAQRTGGDGGALNVMSYPVQTVQRATLTRVP